jgi:hypothetical protein
MSENETPVPKDTQLVEIISLNGDEFDSALELHADDLAAYLAQWDYGDENDMAAPINGYTSVSDAERFGAEIISHDNLQYWLTIDRNFGMCSLMRRPLTDLVDPTNLTQKV